MRRHPVAGLVLIGLLASAAGIALGIAIDWFPTQASEQGKNIDTVYDVLVITSVPFFVLVTVVVLYCVYAFRMRPGQEAEDGPPIHGNTRLEVIWTLIPAILLVGLCSYAYAELTAIEERKPNELVVNVTGEQFAWSFEYPAEKGGKKVVSNQLYVPRGRSVYFNVRSKDVIHDFWVPEWRMKIDATPGVVTHFRVTPTKLGEYPVVCAELCGLGHAAMRQSAHVLEPDEFAAWLDERASGAAGAPTGKGGGTDIAAAGKQLFASQGCGACHVLADAGASGATGPSLDESLKGKDEDYILQAIVDPEAVIAKGFPGGVMPGNYEEAMSKDEVAALVAYLAKVTK